MSDEEKRFSTGAEVVDAFKDVAVEDLDEALSLLRDRAEEPDRDGFVFDQESEDFVAAVEHRLATRELLTVASGEPRPTPHGEPRW